MNKIKQNNSFINLKYLKYSKYNYSKNEASTFSKHRLKTSSISS